MDTTMTRTRFYRVSESATCATVSCKGGQKCLSENNGRPRCVTCNLPCADPGPQLAKKRKDMDGPVCGDNEKTYRSWCYMFMDACATGVVIETKASGPCRGREAGERGMLSSFSGQRPLKTRDVPADRGRD